MKAKTKKLTYLTAGLTGALAASAVVGSALSSCTVTASNSTNGGITLPDSWYNKDINWNDSSSLNNLLIDDQGLVYSSKYMTEIIAVLPGYGGGTITIPASVKTISGYYNVTTNSDTSTTTRTATGAFEGLTSLTTVVFAGKNVTQIGAQAFKGCTSLQTISLPSSVTLIADSAFENCTSLDSINLNNIQYIGASAFSGAFSNIPYGSISLDLNKTSYIGASAFANATGIKTADLSKNTVLTTIGESAFANCNYLTGSINITNDKYLVTIGASAFSGCTGITNVYLSDSSSLKTIGASAFAGCTSLVSIGASGVTSGFIIPSTVTSIGASAFANTLIAKIDLSQNTATNPLLASALKDMTELTSIDLGTSITTLNEDLFDNTPKLSDFDLVLPASITSIASGNGTNVGSSSYIPSSYSTFYNSGFKSIDLSNISSTATDLGYGYFEDCSNLQTIKLKSTITQIKFRAFYNCSSLKTVTFVSSDSTSATADTTGFVAPAGLTFLGSYAFYNTGLESIDLSAVTTDIMGTKDNYDASTSNNTNRFANSAELTTVKLPTATTHIPRYNFYNTPKLKSVNFDQLTSLASISIHNFSGTAFEEIDLSSTKITSFSSNNIFDSLTNKATVKLPATLVEITPADFTYVVTSTDGTSTTASLPLIYPNGFGDSTTLLNSKIFTSSGANLTFLSRVSGELDFSNFAAFNGLGRNTTFGSSSITSLKFAASTFADGTIGTTGSSGSWNSYLGFVGTGITEAGDSNTTTPSTYAAANLPFGNMSSLETITFDNFTNATSSDSATTDVLAKTTNETWYEVARIISSFGKETVEDASKTTANLSSWEVSTAVTAEVTSGDSGVVNQVVLKTNGGNTTLTTITGTSTNEFSFDLASVKWTIKVDTTAGTITITSSGDVDTYRAVVATDAGAYSNTYKAFFNTKSTEVEDSSGVTTTYIVPDSSITITLNVVATSTN